MGELKQDMIAFQAVGKGATRVSKREPHFLLGAINQYCRGLREGYCALIIRGLKYGVKS